jgi:hypothetical protein
MTRNLAKKPRFSADLLPPYSLLIFAIVAIILTGLTYGRTLTLPFLFDDLVQFPFVDRYTFAQHWTGSNESPYYRPLVISVWKLLANITNGHSAPLQHTLNLGFHGLNGYLTAWLGIQIFNLTAEGHSLNLQAARQGNHPTFLFGLTTLILYLLFPFHHQAIPWPGALFHILVTTLILVALLAYLKGWVVISLLFAFVAPFAHENGVVVPALIFLIEFSRFANTKAGWRKVISRPIMMSIPAVLWLIIRSLVSASREGQPLFPGIESIRQSATWFFQGLTWPGAIFGRGLLAQPWLNDLKVVWIVGALVILISILVCFRSKSKSTLLIFGAGWWLAASAPALLVLPFGYIVNSPRLLSLAACGIAIFWAAVICELVDWLLNRPIGRKSIAALLLIVFGMAQLFALQQIREANQFHLMLGDVYKRATEIAEKLDNRHDYPVFINFPSSVAPNQKTFVLGNEGVVFWPGYAPQHTIVTTNGNVEKIDQVFVQVDGIRTEQPYLYGIVRPTGTLDTVQNDTHAIFYNTVYSADRIDLLEVGKLTHRIVHDVKGTFALEPGIGQIQLVDWHSTRDIIAGQEVYRLKIEWVMGEGAQSAESVTAFLHAVSESGEMISQADGDPLMGLMPLSLLATGDGVSDIRTVPADSKIAAFRLGLYNRVTGERLPFYDAAGNRTTDDMFLVPIVKQ